MKENTATHLDTMNNVHKSILARGCDPMLSLQASKAIPPLIGNPEYIPTTSDVDFIEQLRSRKWSVIYFAPGACRFSAAAQHIPGGNAATAGWTLTQYRELIYKLQGDEIQIVETPFESQSIKLLKEALARARNTH